MYIPVHHGEFFCQSMALLRTVFRLRLVLLVVRLLSTIPAIAPRMTATFQARRGPPSMAQLARKLARLFDVNILINKVFCGGKPN